MAQGKRGRPKGRKPLQMANVGINDPVIRTAMMKWLGIRPSEIAEMEGISTQAVQQRVHEAVAKGFNAPMQLALGQSKIYELLHDALGELDHLVHIRARLVKKYGEEEGNDIIDKDPKMQRALLEAIKEVTDKSIAFIQKRKIAEETAAKAQEPTIDTPIEEIEHRIDRLVAWRDKLKDAQVEAVPASFEVLEEKSLVSETGGMVGESPTSVAASSNNHIDSPIVSDATLKTEEDTVILADNTAKMADKDKMAFTSDDKQS